jgi:hypothetical protein|tara:strand:- start:368 stop:661 length:294 start_codon:yes stop_codon:yes gene_type:complete
MYIKNIGKVPLMTIKDKRSIFNKVTKENSKKVVRKSVSQKIKNMAKKHGITITFKRNNKRLYKSEAQIKKQIELKKKRVKKKRVKKKRKRKMKKRRK